MRSGKERDLGGGTLQATAVNVGEPQSAESLRRNRGWGSPEGKKKDGERTDHANESVKGLE